MPESPMDRAVTIFDAHKKDLLTFTVRLGGRDQQLYLLDEMLYDDHKLLDYQKLASRLRKLPAVLAFFITIKKNAENVLSDREDEFKAWYGQAEEEANTANLAEQAAQGGPASLKKPLTAAQLQAKVMNAHPAEWRMHKDVVRAAKERVDLLSALYEGLRAAIDMARSEERLVNTLLVQGFEKVQSHPDSRFQPRNRA